MEAVEKEPTLLERLLLVVDSVKAQFMTRRVAVESKVVKDLHRVARVGVDEAEAALREAEQRLTSAQARAEALQQIASEVATAKSNLVTERKQLNIELRGIAAECKQQIEAARLGAAAVTEAEERRQREVLDQIAALEQELTASQDRVVSAHDRAEAREHEAKVSSQKAGAKAVRKYHGTAAQTRQTIKQARQQAQKQLS